MRFDPSTNGPWLGAGVPLTFAAADGSESLCLIDLPEEPSGPLVPVVIPPVFGRTKEEMGSLAEALISTGRFIAFRPSLRNMNDEAPGPLDDIELHGEELAHWGHFARSEAFALAVRKLNPAVTLDGRVACVAVSVGAYLAFAAQEEHGVFDAMVLLSFVPEISEFVTRKTGVDFYRLVASLWRERLEDQPEKRRQLAAEYRECAQGSDAESARRYRILAERLESEKPARRQDFAVQLEGVPYNCRRVLDGIIEGLWESNFGLSRLIERSKKIDLPLTFIIGGRDDYFDAEKMDEFLVRAREGGRTRRAIRIQGADHKMKPYPCFIEAVAETIRWLGVDLHVELRWPRISLARIGMRRFHEVCGFAARNHKKVGVPEELLQRFMLRKDDLREILASLLENPEEVAELARLLDRSRTGRGDGTTILDDLNPARLAKIIDSAIEPRHHATIAAGLAAAPEEGAALLSPAMVDGLGLEHLDGILHGLSTRTEEVLRLIGRLDPRTIEALGRRRALRQALRAWHEVPAFRWFAEVARHVPAALAEEGAPYSGNGNGFSEPPAQLEDFPITDKASYVKAFPLDARCVRGVLPADGLLEESGGSGGVPTHWVRCRAEDDWLVGHTSAFFEHILSARDPARPMVVLSGFSQGAWASSGRLTVLGRYAALVKDVGPEIAGILETMERMGPAYHYVLAGYPPFLRELVRAGEARAGFAWNDYCVDLMHGGEGYTAAWRSYMREVFGHRAAIVSCYGASDLEVGMAFETPLALAVREGLEDSLRFRRELLGDERIPVFVGQYSPLESYLEERIHPGGRTSIVATINNPKAWQPRVRYDIGDEGGVRSLQAVRDAAARHGIGLPEAGILQLPFVHVFGRIDGTISLDGGNVSPAEIQEAILSNERLRALVRSFRVQRAEEQDGSVRFRVRLEPFGATPADPALREEAARAITDHLCRVNSDYRESFRRNPTLKARVEFVPPGTFALDQSVKHRYIA